MAAIRLAKKAGTLVVDSITLTSKWVAIHLPQAPTTGAPSQITSFIPATGSVRRRIVVVTTAAIGRLLRSIRTSLTTYTSTVAAWLPRIATVRATGSLYAV